jgi:hypothetical protein
MKKLLLLVLLLSATVLTARAEGEHFLYDGAKYHESTVVYVALENASHVKYSLDDATYYLGAFIGDECRGEATPTNVRNGNAGPVLYCGFTLRVWGDGAEDAGKPITFRLYRKELPGALPAFGEEFVFPGTVNVAFQSDTTPYAASSPFTIAFIPAETISLPATMTVHRDVPVDMTAYLTVTPDGALLPTLTWDTSASGGNLKMEGNMLTGLAVTPEATLSVTTGRLTANTAVTVDAPATSVALKEEYVGGATVNINDADALTALLENVYTTVPADATTTFNWTSGNEAIVTFVPTNGKWNPIATGTVTMTGTATDDSGLTLTLDVTVVQPVTGIEIGKNVVMVQVGDDVTEYLSGLITVLPAAATNKNYTITADGDNSTLTVRPADNHLIAAEAWDYTDKTLAASHRVIISAQDGSGVTTTATVYVIAKQPTAISAKEPTIYLINNIGLDCTDDLFGNLQPTPADIDLAAFPVELAISNPAVITKTDGTPATYHIAGPGTTTVDATVTVLDNENATMNMTNGSINVPTIGRATSFTVTVQETLAALAFGDVTMTREENYSLQLTVQPGGAVCDATKIRVEVKPMLAAGAGDAPVGWTYVSVSKDDTKELTYTLDAKSVGCGVINVYYDDVLKGSGNITVGQQLKVANGWQWVALCQGGFDSKAAIQTAFGNNLDEVRSQDALLYNDTEIGYFGELATMVGMQTYKLKMKGLDDEGKSCMVPYGVAYNYFVESADTKTIAVRKGWNWTGNPYQYTQPLATALALNTFSEGDIIKGKTAFAQFTGGAWSGSLTAFAPGEGYLLKLGAAGNLKFAAEQSMSQNAPAPAAAPISMAPELYRFDATKYADNMAMVTTVDMVSDPTRCTLWAFVGNECRGQGVTVGDRQYIVVHGTSGEQVTFRVYDEVTGLLHNVPGVHTLTAVSGSHRQPVLLSAGEVTSVHEIRNETLEMRNAPWYDLQGRKLQGQPTQKGVYLIGGRKVVKR